MTEILESARKHGLSDERILHAFRNPIRIHELGEITVLRGSRPSGSIA